MSKKKTETTPTGMEVHTEMAPAPPPGPVAPPMVRSAVVKLRGMWLATQPATHDNGAAYVTLTRDEAAALYEHISGPVPA